jgi:hypothetical protein
MVFKGIVKVRNCGIFTGTPPLDVIWVKDGMEIPDCEDFRYVDHGDGRFGLRLADVFPQDSGEYRCEAYNEHGDAFTKGIVSVRGTLWFFKSVHAVRTIPW